MRHFIPDESFANPTYSTSGNTFSFLILHRTEFITEFISSIDIYNSNFFVSSYGPLVLKDHFCNDITICRIFPGLTSSPYLRYLTSPHLTLPDLTLPDFFYVDFRYVALPHLSLPHLSVPYLLPPYLYARSSTTFYLKCAFQLYSRRTKPFHFFSCSPFTTMKTTLRGLKGLVLQTFGAGNAPEHPVTTYRHHRPSLFNRISVFNFSHTHTPPTNERTLMLIMTHV